MGTPRHSVMVYRDERFLIGSVTALINASFDLYDTVVVIVTQKHGKDLCMALTIEKRLNETLRLVDTEDLSSQFMVGDWPYEPQFIQAMERILAPAGVRGPARIMNELAGVLCAEGNAGAASRVEELWNHLVTPHRFPAECISLSALDEDGGPTRK